MSMFLKHNLGFSSSANLSFNYLESKNQLGNLSYILSISHNYLETVEYFFKIFSNILDEIINIKGKNYIILSFFYDLVDLLKIKYNKSSSTIQTINACCECVSDYMKEHTFSQKSNYELLNEIIKGKKMIKN
jgi:hypothetical protein